MVRRLMIVSGALLLGATATEAFVPHAPLHLSCVVPSGCAARCSSVQLRMGLGDMFGNAFANNPNIPTAKATGPGSPGFSKPKPTTAQATTTLELEAPVAPPPAAALWQQATDEASGNPYWFNTETRESSWTPPVSTAPPPMAEEPVAPPAGRSLIQQRIDEAAAEETEDEKYDKLQRQLTNLNKFLTNGFIDQETYDEQKAEIQAKMPKAPVYDATSLKRPFTTTTIKWGALVDTACPKGWVEGKQYDRQTKIQVGSLVGISRSDGTIKFGQVVKESGLFYEDFWQVCVSMKDDGTPGATRIEEGVMLIRPTPAGMEPVLAAMPDITVNEKEISLEGDKKKKGFFGSMFAEAVYEGGSAAPDLPANPPQTPVAPAKAVVPAGIIPKASPPAGIMSDVPPPTQAPPAARNAPAEKKSSEWI